MPTGSDNTNLLVGILVPVFCIFVVATFLIVYFYRKWKLIKTKSNELHQRLLNSHGFELEQGESENFFGISTFGDGRAVPETPLLNTKLEVSLPGFLKMDYKTQLEIGENIGGGGSAEIYKGVLIDQNLQMKYGFSEVAIKQIKDEANLTEEQNRIKFQQEVAILWSLDNQLNVMKLIGYSIKPRYIITKLYPTDLFKFIHTSTIEITSKMIFNLTFEISTGLTAIHGNQIAHRDIKSPNILLEAIQENGKTRMRAVICDFGIARSAGGHELPNTLMFNIQGMSPRYTAPEIFSHFKSKAAVFAIPNQKKKLRWK